MLSNQSLRISRYFKAPCVVNIPVLLLLRIHIPGNEDIESQIGFLHEIGVRWDCLCFLTIFDDNRDTIPSLFVGTFEK